MSVSKKKVGLMLALKENAIFIDGGRKGTPSRAKRPIKGTETGKSRAIRREAEGGKGHRGG